MIKTLKHISLNTLLVSGMFLLLNNVQAQSIIFSPDQWPKRWERAMQNQPMNGHMVSARYQRNSSHTNDQRNGVHKVSHQGWGQQPDEKRHRRSRTPEYNYESHNRYEVDPLKQRYALPGTLSNSYGYGSYSAPGYYGSTIPAYPYMPATTYPGVYPGIYPGAGIPGLPYAAPLYMGPGIYPGARYPGLGYPW